MKRNPIDWSCVANGVLVDTSALHLTNKQKCDIEVDNEKEKRMERRQWNMLMFLLKKKI